MNTYQILTFLGSILSFIVSYHLIRQHHESRFHRIYAMGFIACGLYSFFIFGVNSAATDSEAWTWLKLSAVIHFVPPLTSHAILLVASPKKSKNRFLIGLLYLPFLFFIIQDGYFPELSYVGFDNATSGREIIFDTDSPFQVLNMLTYFSCIMVQAGIVVSMMVGDKNPYKKKFAWFVGTSYVIPIFICAILVYIVPYFLDSVLRLESIFILIACLATIFSLVRYNIFDLSTDLVSRDIISGMSNFLLVLNTQKEIIDANPKALDLLKIDKKKIPGLPLADFLAEDDFRRIFEPNSHDGNAELNFKDASGKAFPAIITTSEIVKKNELLGSIVIGSDLTKVYNIIEEKKIIELELKALLRQMNPHFLFNSLNGIQHYINSHDEEKANLYLTKFSRLMRNLLSAMERDHTTIREEIDQLTLYLELESLRFSSKFQYSLSVDDELPAELCMIPTMILQPFIENAIWHGLLPKKGEANLKVHFGLQDDETILCTVEDNGIGRKKAAEKKLHEPGHRSTAINNITNRIQLINKKSDNEVMDLKIVDKADDQGTLVIIRLPLKMKHFDKPFFDHEYESVNN